VVVIAAFAVTAAGCGPTTAAWIDTVGKAIEDSRGTAQDADAIIVSGRSKIDSALENATKTAKAKPSNPSPEEINVAKKLEQTQTALNQVVAVIEKADATKADLSPSANKAVSVTFTDRGYLLVRSKLEEMGRDILYDITCGFAEQYLNPADAMRLRSRYQRIPAHLAEATEKSLQEYVERRLANLVGGPSYGRMLAEIRFADNLLSLASNYTAGLDQQVEFPTWPTTRAYFYYIRLCLRPPK
jgi:hypothetical protein